MRTMGKFEEEEEDGVGGECLPGLTFPEAACGALLRRETLTLA